MSKFVLKKIKAVVGTHVVIQQLEIDGVPQLDEFENNLEAQYQAEFKQLLTWIDHYSSGGKLPVTKLKMLKRAKSDAIVDFEFRSKNLRLYAVQRPNGKVIVSCCYKKNQKQDLAAFRKLKVNIQPTIAKINQ